MSDEVRRLLEEYDGNIDWLLAGTKKTVKIRRSGNTSAVTIPQKWLAILGWKEGDLLEARLDKSKGTITLQKSKFQEQPAETEAKADRNVRTEGEQVLTKSTEVRDSGGVPDSNPGPTSSSEGPSVETQRA